MSGLGTLSLTRALQRFVRPLRLHVQSRPTCNCSTSAIPDGCFGCARKHRHPLVVLPLPSAIRPLAEIGSQPLQPRRRSIPVHVATLREWRAATPAVVESAVLASSWCPLLGHATALTGLTVELSGARAGA